ncbi:Ubiquitin-conjugating enzyme [Penicillium macrosclerotiorum]|uniref:Ubiquitin-conjugating enzyme n=1 Tax=Penicillium macrosclerotiorum TaxID=303699 RepID=UPI00254918A8|nr:Ubiquitin-conjugating enzyme [Penicillium macrosclerotiorum]KAJ5689040.1 Ubiquitin-conjugating enzyme [Penicillium macrosclerotiorum]
MASNRTRRVGKELADIHADPHSQIKAEPVGNQDDVTHLRGSFPGPPDTPYQGGTYNIDIKIPLDYPFRPPVMKFETKVWHPNVSSQTGAICLDTLSSAWSPVLTIKSALISLQSLLSTPEPKDPQDAEVANMLLQRPKEFERVAREWAVIYAGAPSTGGDGCVDGTAESPVTIQDNSLALYNGYDQALVDTFGAMGFQVPDIVRVFAGLGIDRQSRTLNDTQNDDVCAQLLAGV